MPIQATSHAPQATHIICHTPEHMIDVLQKARADDDVIALQSPSPATQYLGVPVIWAMWQQAKRAVPDTPHHFILDCGDDASAVMNGIRTGFTRFLYAGPRETAAKLQNMAQQADGMLVSPPESVQDMLEVARKA